MTIKIFIGTINYTDFLHVTVSKVSAPNDIVYETLIDVPVTNYTLAVPNLDADNYYVRFYDAPDNTSLGLLVSECFVSALTPEYEYEMRPYVIGSLAPGVASTDTTLTDPYLIGREVHEVFKEGFRPLILSESAPEVAFDDTIGELTLLGPNLSDGEVLWVTVKHATGVLQNNSGGALYSGTLTVTASTHTLSADDRNKRVRLVCPGTKQAVTLPALSALSNDDGYYFDNQCGGAAFQVRIITAGSNVIRYSGLGAPLNQHTELWVGVGETLLLRRFDATAWEVIGEYKGTKVGRQIALDTLDRPGTLIEDGRLIDGDEWPRLYWWLLNKVPSAQVVRNSAAVVSGTRDGAKPGCFILNDIGSPLKTFRMPDTQNLHRRGLRDFDSYGTLTDRPFNYPGGFQDHAILNHGHNVITTGDQTGVDPGRSLQRADNNGDGYLPGVSSTGPWIQRTGGEENCVKNFGVIWAREA
mgnify:CR=1 FL=1